MIGTSLRCDTCVVDVCLMSGCFEVSPILNYVIGMLFVRVYMCLVKYICVVVA